MSPIKIKKLRRKLGLTQEQAAEVIHISKVTWQQWEAGKRKIHPAFWELFNLKTNMEFESKQMKEIFSEHKSKDIRDNNHQLAIETHISEQKESINKDFTFIDLFAGIGGIRKAFESVGGGCVFSSEIDYHAQYTYYTNFGVVPFGDITQIDPLTIPKHDVICAGFPCQPFSSIGKREGFEHPTQGTMFHEILNIIDIKKPKVVFLENVAGIINHDKKNTLKVIISELEKRNYKVHYTLLNAKDFGVPQSRNRFYLVAFSTKVDFEFPNPPMLSEDIGKYVETGVKGYSISKHLQKSYLFKVDDGRPAIIDQNTKGHIKTLVSTYHKIQRLTGTFVRDGETGLRLLTASECKAIMGFPEDFVIPVSRTQMYRQMGNSVVIKVVQKIAKEIVKSLSVADSR